MTDAADLRALVDEVLAGGLEGWEARQRLEHRLRAIENGLPNTADQALTYLELDPYYFWSGYARAHMAKQVARATLDDRQRERARRYVLDCVDGTKHCSQPALGQLARAVADNPLRRGLRSRLHGDASAARRALRTIVHVRHPGMSEADVAVARELVLVDAARTPWLPPSVRRLATWLWTPEWQAELRALTRVHGPHRAAAKKLVEGRRPGP